MRCELAAMGMNEYELLRVSAKRKYFYIFFFRFINSTFFWVAVALVRPCWPIHNMYIIYLYTYGIPTYIGGYFCLWMAKMGIGSTVCVDEVEQVYIYNNLDALGFWDWRAAWNGL